MSVTRTRPAVLIDSMSAGASDCVMLVKRCLIDYGTLTSNRELQISPMKLLSRAICTASFTDIVVRPLL
jgi:hypothetical protein